MACLITLTGLAGFVATGGIRTATGAINPPTIAAATDDHLHLTANTKEKSIGLVHRPEK